MDDEEIRALTYVIDIYFRTSESVDDVGEALRDELRSRRPSIRVNVLSLTPGAPPSYREEWVAYIADATSDVPPESLMVEIWNDPQMMKNRRDLLRDEVTDPTFLQTNSVAVLTLAGSKVDWPVVGSVWRIFSSLWPSIAYDDVSGFDIDLSDLPDLGRGTG